MVAPEGFTSYNVDNDRKFQNAIDKSLRELDDLRTPLKLISNDFYKSEKSIFQLKSQGQYPDFKTEDSREAKFNAVGFDYPLLLRTGALMRSVTSPSASGSFLNIQKTFLMLGTTIEYGKYHQSDRPRKKIPLRKFLFVGPESKRWATKDTTGRTERWVNTLADYYNKKMAKMGKTKRIGKI